MTASNRRPQPVLAGVHFLFLVVAWLPVPAGAQTMLGDIAPALDRSAACEVTEITPFANAIWFVAEDPRGRELWRSDGTAAGTRPFIDLAPGAASSDPRELTVVGNLLFFTADVPGLGRELWRTDGTPAGTVLLADPFPGPESANPRGLVEFSGRLWCVMTDPRSGRELWTSDGTVAGTRVAIDIVPGPDSSRPSLPVTMGGALYFVAYDLVNGYGLWRADAATIARPAIAPHAVGRLTVVGSELFFLGRDPTLGDDLYATDGTVAGTRLVHDFPPGTLVDLNGPPMVASAGRLFFVGVDPSAGSELWTSDGTTAGTLRISDVRPGIADGRIRELVTWNGLALFDADDGVHGREPWISDGTAAGTVMLRDIWPGTEWSAPHDLAVTSAGMVFAASSDYARSSALWITGGTPATTHSIVASTTPLGPVGVASITEIAPGRVAFRGWIGGRWGLWTSDLSPATTREVGMLHVQGRDSRIFDRRPAFVPVGGATLFVARDDVHGDEVWRTDGTPTGTQMVADTQPGGSSSVRSSLVPAFGAVWYRGDAGSPTQLGIELFRSDGTTAGTGMFLDIRPGFRSSDPDWLTPWPGHGLLFTADDGSGREPWITDGTIAGTRRIVDLVPGSWGSSPGSYVALDSTFVFLAMDPMLGAVLYVSDGTPAGTRRLDVDPARSPEARALTRFGDRVLFSAWTTATGRELFVTDGTTAGTRPVADIAPGASDSDPSDPVVAGDLAFFTADEPGIGRELWVTDGTPGGTRAVAERPGTWSRGVSDIAALDDGRVALLADDGQHGAELWTSDGSAAGTRLVVDLLAGPRSSVVGGSLARMGDADRVLFAATDGIDGVQVWTSDGTAAGTFQVGRIGSDPGVGACRITDLTQVGELLYFYADDGEHGLEPWVLSLRGSGLALAERYGTGCAGTGPRIDAHGVPRLANPDFAVELHGARSATSAALNLGLTAADLSVGSCQLLLGLPVWPLGTAATSAAGDAGLPLPIPSDPALQGSDLYAQWVVLDPSGGAFGLASLSDGLALTIGR